MFRGDLIIDGYNVLHAAHLVSGAHRPGGLERDRRVLLRLIASRLAPRERRRTTVVFDAPESVMGASPPQQIEELLVLFADRDGDADATIERLILQNSAPRRLCVVSSDHRLQKAARRRRAKFLDSDVFLAQLARRSSRDEHRPRPEEPTAKRSGGLPPGELEAWLRVFEDVENIRFPPPGRKPEPVPDGPSPPARSVTAHRQPDSKQRRDQDIPVNSDEMGSEFFDEAAFWESRISELDGERPQTRNRRD
ncbi:MAG: NYN domain-containing protein [Planctomycetaceae bacterium]